MPSLLPTFRILTPRAGGLLRGGDLRQGLSRTGQPMTQTQLEMQPYIEVEREKEERKRKRIQPLRWLFDVLQRGQYMGVNVVDEIIESIENREPLGQAAQEALVGAWQGLTGERKGYFEEVLKKYLPEETVAKWSEPILGEKLKGKFLIGATPLDVLGFAGDIALDPLTYIDPLKFFKIGGLSSKTAKAVAGDFATSMVKLKSSFRNLERLKAGFDQVKFNKLLDVARKTGKFDDAAKYIKKFQGVENFDQYLSDVFNKSYRKALMSSGEDLAGLVKKEVDEFFKEAHGVVPEQRLAPYREMLEKEFTGAGTRSWNLLGTEIPLKTTYETPTLAKPFEWVRERLFGTFDQPASPLGQSLKDAWWSISHRGPLGAVFQAFGIRNPYEKMVRFEELERRALEENVSRQLKQVHKIVDPLDDQMRMDLVKVVDKAEVLSKAKAKKAGMPSKWMVGDVLKDTEMLQSLGVDPASANQLENAWNAIDGLNRNYRDLINAGIAKGYWPDQGVIDNYLPALHRTKQFESDVTKARKQARQVSVNQNKAELKLLFGIDDATAEELIRRHNITEFNMDLEQMLIYRGIAQGKLQQYYNLLETFREFGVNTEMAQGALRGQMRRAGAEMQYAGLESIDRKAFKGLLFPSEIARVFDRASAGPREIELVKRFFGGFTSWWKGMVTMTTGFHARNWISNNVTGFLKFGPRWFNMRKNNIPAMVGTLYALYRDQAKGILAEFGMEEGLFNRILKMKIDETHTLQDFADEMFRRGVISHHTRAFTPEITMAAAKAKPSANIFSQEFVGRKWSRSVGDVVENSARFQSALMDLRDVMARQGGKITDEGLDFASKEAKKWFIDYQDLSEFEQRIMRNVIPFYSWIRKNLANQLSGIWLYPELYSILPKLENAATLDDPDYDPDMIPDWMKQYHMFPVRKEDGGFTMFNPNIPIQDINKIPIVFEDYENWKRPRLVQFEEIKQEIMNSAHPLVKMLVQVIPSKGYDVFYRRDLDYDADAPMFLRWLVKSPKTLQRIDGIMKDIGIENGLDVHLTADNKVKMNAKVVKVMEDFLPFIRQLDKAFQAGATFIPGFEEAINEAAGFYDRYDKADPADVMERFFQFLAFYGGVKFKMYDPEEERLARGWEIYNRARGARTKQQRRETPEEQRLSEFYERRERTVGDYGI